VRDIFFVIAVCTLGENHNLSRVLSELLQIKDKSELHVEILVVINNAEHEISFDSKVQVVFEPKRGYSSVRNTAIDKLPPNANLIFIDDDEIPSLSWFEGLVEKHKKFPNDVIFGPVYPENLEDIHSYRNQFRSEFESLTDEALVDQCATANMLIPSGLISSGLVKFDPLFDLIGGEDTDLCFRLRRIGVKIRYAKSAFVTEVESEERSNLEYLDSRKLREIVTYSLIVRRNSSLGLKFWRLCTSLMRISIYGATSPWMESSQTMCLVHCKSLKALLLGRL
jgi:glycosyltransferase involved in cell wall biosynthesis